MAWIENEAGQESGTQLSEHVLRYAERTKSPERADLLVRWSNAEYQQAVRALTSREDER